MMETLLKRGEELAAAGQQQKLQDLAGQLGAIFGKTAVQVDRANVLVRGRGIIKRWLMDPGMRFLIGGPE
jgi:hypothetical protein